MLIGDSKNKVERPSEERYTNGTLRERTQTQVQYWLKDKEAS
jgi:hypothetical protein